ncbi:MAG: hypothetical protein ACRCXL_09865 [Dermatophilaceae bacterium]
MARSCAAILLPVVALTVISLLGEWTLMTVLAGGVVLLWASFAIHESGHVMALRLLASRQTPAAFVVNRSGPALHRPPLPSRWRESIVLLSGPLAPVTAWAAMVWALNPPASITVWTGVIAWGHPIALLAPVGDGVMLMRTWRSRTRKIN